MFKKSKDSYLILEKHFSGEKYYTNDPYLIKMDMLKTRCGTLVGLFGILTFFFILGFGLSLIPYAEKVEIMYSLALIIINISLGVVGLIFLILTIVFGCLCDEIDYIDIFQKSNEYKDQEKAYVQKYKKEKEQIRREKATQLTNIYETLDSQQSKEEKIEKITEYLK